MTHQGAGGGGGPRGRVYPAGLSLAELQTEAREVARSAEGEGEGEPSTSSTLRSSSLPVLRPPPLYEQLWREDRGGYHGSRCPLFRDNVSFS